MRPDCPATMWRWAPPPTRRCARGLPARRGRAGGSSAHAEMRRGTSPVGAGTSGLLRPRGDAPMNRDLRIVCQRAPSPTRRCAPAAGDADDAGRGSSAHAEMRPGGVRAERRARRLLRPRGDAPRSGSRSVSSRRAPPPTRRCAVLGVNRQEHGCGSSAHAEMRPAITTSTRRQTVVCPSPSGATLPPTV